MAEHGNPIGGINSDLKKFREGVTNAQKNLQAALKQWLESPAQKKMIEVMKRLE